MVNSKVVATQQAYVHAFMKESYRELKHYCCSKCGEVWGHRVVPDFVSPHHYFYREDCISCGGKGDMLTPWEAMNMDVLSPNVLAYLILSTDRGGLLCNI